jgi:hypothetical protein
MRGVERQPFSRAANAPHPSLTRGSATCRRAAPACAGGRKRTGSRRRTGSRLQRVWGEEESVWERERVCGRSGRRRLAAGGSCTEAGACMPCCCGDVVHHQHSQPGSAQVARLRSVFQWRWYCCPRNSILAYFCSRFMAVAAGAGGGGGSTTRGGGEGPACRQERGAAGDEWWVAEAASGERSEGRQATSGGCQEGCRPQR